MRTPLFWKDHNFISTALLPAAWLYRRMAERNTKGVMPFKLPVPVICVGNLVAGGAGKTPTALAIGAMLKAQGVTAHFLTRGYKGKLAGPVQVNVLEHTAQDVGDEALLLAEILPTWVARDRVAGGKAAVKAGAEFIVMDDGFQNPALHKDVSFLVIDGMYGVGNGRLIPAGPLREPVADGLDRATAIVLFGQDKHGVLRQTSPYKKVLETKLVAADSAHTLRGKPVVAFAGIARPRKFYRTLHDMGCEVRHMTSFPDHYMFRKKEIMALQAKAQSMDCALVTTTKDYVRLPKDLRVGVFPVQVQAVFNEPDALWRIIFP
jgi:tetraacyldisaccharide 4'-kinase